MSVKISLPAGLREEGAAPEALSNAHTHTSLCDGQNTPAEMAAAAYEMGFKSLGFSGHSYCPGEDYGMKPAALADYCAQVRALQEVYSGRMRIYLGLELDSLSEKPGEVHNKMDFDYLIGSVHDVVAENGRVWTVDESPEKTAAGIVAFGGAENYWRAYFAGMEEMLERREVNIVGHFDLVCKYNAGGRFFDEALAAYRELAERVLRRYCREYVFEINTGAMFRGYLQRPYPDYWLWEVLRQEGAWVMVNSDAHSARGLAYGLAEMRRRAREFGLKLVDIDELLGK